MERVMSLDHNDDGTFSIIAQDDQGRSWLYERCYVVSVDHGDGDLDPDSIKSISIAYMPR